MSSPVTTGRPAAVPTLPDGIFRGSDPVVSIYLTTEGALPQAADEVALRWKAMRARLRDDGAEEACLTALDTVIDGSHAEGQTLAALADPDGLLYTAHLPDPPERDLGSVGPLPHLLPLLAATRALLPHVVVVTDRLGAELIAVLPDRDDRHVAVDGDELHVARSAPGGWSQRRFQQRAENTWEANAGAVADALTGLVDRHRPRLVVISGDVRAVQLLRDQVPKRVADLLREVQGDYSGLDEALHRSRELVTEVADADSAQLLEDYRDRFHSGLAVAGPDATLQALQVGQVETLLLDPVAALEQDAWFGPELTQVSAAAAALHAAGVEDVRPAPLADVAIRAATGTAAAVHVLPAGAPELAHGGVAALLRYR